MLFRNPALAVRHQIKSTIAIAALTIPKIKPVITIPLPFAEAAPRSIFFSSIEEIIKIIIPMIPPIGEAITRNGNHVDTVSDNTNNVAMQESTKETIAIGFRLSLLAPRSHI